MIPARVRAHRMIIAYDEHIGHLYVPSSKVRVPHVEYPYFVKTNKQGFRSEYDFVEEKDSGEIRIVFLGDSFTAGENVDNKHRFSNLIEKELGCECYNFGLAGSGVDQQLLIHERIANKFDHEILIISPHIEDIERNMLKERIGSDRRTGRKIVTPKPYFTVESGGLNLHNVPVPRPYFSCSSKNTIRNNITEIRRQLRGIFYDWTPAIVRECILKILKSPLSAGYLNETTKEWILMEKIISRIIRNGKDKEIFLMPLPHVRTYLNVDYQKYFNKIAEEYSNVTFVDVEQHFNKYSKQKRELFRFDYGHYTPEGHKAVAEVLTEALKTEGFFKTRKRRFLQKIGKKEDTIKLLGISAFYHDSAASLIIDGEIVAAAHEERFSRKKHDKRFPYAAINYCLEEAELDINQLDAVVFYDKNTLSLERIISSHLAVAPEGVDLWNDMVVKWVLSNLDLERIIKTDLGFKGNILHTEHHRSHAASAFFASPFKEAAILTIDGVGEWATATISHGKGHKLQILKELRYPHSVGLLYSAFTQYAGFKVNSGEYKLMGLAPYGNPIYVEKIKENIVEIGGDGSIKLNLEFFDFMSNNKLMISKKFERLFGGPPREPETQLTQKYMDIAKSIQLITEEIVLKMAKHAQCLTGCKYLCMAGGVALNCVANGRLLREHDFEDVWIQPAAGDAGGSLGAALDAYYSYFNKSRELDAKGKTPQRGSYWGPSYSSEEILAFLRTYSYMYHELKPDERAKTIATYLSKGKIIGHFSGRMEFGPRALGARSILGDARNERTQSILNLKIKYRESFRPFAPTVLEEDISNYFEIDKPSPYMLLVAPVVQKRRLPISNPHNRNIINMVNLKRSDIPAVTHIDYSARIQSINGEDHQKYYNLIK